MYFAVLSFEFVIVAIALSAVSLIWYGVPAWREGLNRWIIKLFSWRVWRPGWGLLDFTSSPDADNQEEDEFRRLMQQKKKKKTRGFKIQSLIAKTEKKMKDNNNAAIIVMLEELLTISKSQRTEQTVNANVDLNPIKELIRNGNRENTAKSTKFAGTVINELSKIHKRMDAFDGQKQPDVEHQQTVLFVS